MTDERLERIYKINILDAEQLYKLAEQHNDRELMKQALEDKQKWSEKLKTLQEIEW